MDEHHRVRAVKVDLKVPKIPDFIVADVAGAEVSIAIARVPEADLEQLADRWKRDLLASAKARRASLESTREVVDLLKSADK